MSKAIKCDRCGFCFNPEKTYLCKETEGVTHEYYQRVNFSDMVVSTPITTAEHKFLLRKADVDLCPMCAEEFLVWMANGESVERYLNLDAEEKQDEQSDNVEDQS